MTKNPQKPLQNLYKTSTKPTPGREKRGATSVPHSKHHEKNWSEVSTGGDSFLPKLSFSISHQQQSLVDDHDGRDNWLWRKSQSPLIPKRTPFFLSAVPEAGLGHSVPSCLQRAHTPLTLAFLFSGGPGSFCNPKRLFKKNCLGLLFLLLKDSQFFDCLLATKTANPFVFVQRKVEFLGKS